VISRVAVVHGPNLNLLGTREPERYGRTTLAAIDERLRALGEAHGVAISTYQSNSEGDLVTYIQTAGPTVDAFVINPAAYTHSSIAIRDALLATGRPFVEVHLTNVYAREPFRHVSTIADVAVGRVMGFGALSYDLALLGLLQQASPLSG
jgi:3-dehydroquinate dehydratase-2